MKRMIGLVCVLLGIGLCGTSMADSVWTAAGPGDFSDGSKWTGGVPGAADKASFTAAGDYAVTWLGHVTNNTAVVSWTTTGKTLTEQIGAYTWTLATGFDVGINGTDRCNVRQTSGNLVVTNAAGNDTFIIGNRGQTSYTLTNGTIVADYVRVGYNYDGDNNTLTIGTNGVLTMKAEPRIGFAGGADGNAMVITNGGKVYQTGGDLRVGNDGIGNRLVVNGPGSRLERSSSGSIYMGMAGGAGFNNELTISAGGYVTNAGGLAIGYESTVNDSNVMWVDGSNSTYVGGTFVLLGRYGDFNQIIITNGGRFTSLTTGPYDVQVGGDNGGGGNRLLVTGTNSLWESYCLNLGRSYNASSSGRMNVSNQIEVANGGRMTISANLIIGGGSQSSNCLMTVQGPGALVTVGDSLTLGENVKGWNLLTVSNAATLRVATNLYVGQYSSATTDNTLRVSAGTLTVTNAAGTGTLNLWRGGLTVQGSEGTIVVDKLDMTGGSAASTLAFVADSNGVTTVKVNSTNLVNSSNRLSVDVTALKRSGLYVLVDYGSMPTPFSAGNVSVTGNFRPYVLDQVTGNKITLNLPLHGSVMMIK